MTLLFFSIGLLEIYKSTFRCLRIVFLCTLFLRPYPNSTFTFHNAKGIKFMARLHLINQYIFCALVFKMLIRFTFSLAVSCSSVKGTLSLQPWSYTLLQNDDSFKIRILLFEESFSYGKTIILNLATVLIWSTKRSALLIMCSYKHFSYFFLFSSSIFVQWIDYI